MKSVVTEYTDYCLFCGRSAEAGHHLLFGNRLRKLAEQDGIKVPSCDRCHNMGVLLCRIHDNPMAEKLSKMLGQAIWEKEYYRKQQEDPAREAFRKRYGKSYL